MTNKNKRKTFHDESEMESIIQKAMTSIRRTGKIVRTFQCQKMVRKIKQIQNPTRIQQMEEQLEHFKNLDLNELVEISKSSCQLLDFQQMVNNEKMNQDRTTMDIMTLHPMDRDVITSIMEHPRMKDCFQNIRESITIYKNKVLRREQRYHEKRKKRKRNPSSNGHKSITKEGYNEYIGTSGVFIQSLSGINNSGNNDNDDVYGEGEEQEQEQVRYEYHESTKKNRPGQRARNAKKLAIQARKEGKSWTSSNWRPKKNNVENNDESTETTKTTKQKPNVKASDVANTGSNWKSDGFAHPSWLAAQRQKKEGIAQFTGTKITFD